MGWNDAIALLPRALQPALITAGALHVAALCFFLKRKFGLALPLLLAGGALLRLYFIELDPFLHDWDERFHALVGANTGQHFLKPTLREYPLLGYSPFSWVFSHVWLHKQPLFLWQIGWSVNFFGRNEFALRLPSAIEGVLLIAILNDLGKRLFNPETGFLAAFFFSLYHVPLDLTSGYTGMDHNDMAFCFYVTVSLWAWFRYEQSRRRGWLVLMALASGGAVLVKWLTGLLVFATYGCYHLLEGNLLTRRVMIDGVFALGITLLAFLPWQWYIFHHYPIEAQYEFQYNSRHFTEVLEGHAESIGFYWKQLPSMYHHLEWVAILAMILVLLPGKNNNLHRALIASVVGVYLFFTLAATKMWGYPLMVMPLVLLYIAYGGWLLLEKILLRRVMATVTLVLLFSLILFQPNRLLTSYFDLHTWYAPIRSAKTYNAAVMRHWTRTLPADAVVVNIPNDNELDFMFYSALPAFGTGLTEQQVNHLQDLHKKIYWVNTPPSAAWKLREPIYLLPEEIR
ncbi:MAG: glycosyltransferase family 39 protein [Chitinophagales bacterium]